MCLLSMHHAKTAKVESHSCEALGDGTSRHSGLVPTQRPSTFGVLSRSNYPCRLSVADCSKRVVTVRLSVSPDVRPAHCMSKIYVPGGAGAEGLPYHAGDGSFVSGAIPEDEASGGRTAGSQESKICCCTHKGRQFGGPALNELWPRWKTRASVWFLCPPATV